MSEVDAVRVYELFTAAYELAPTERSAFLSRECGPDSALQAEVESLLEHEGFGPLPASGGAKSDGLLVRGSHPLLPDGALTGELAEGRRIGRYTIVRTLGWGGMGTVYEARQDDPERHVALKLLRTGMGSGQLADRFRHEAQILGRLQHPGIAQIFEAGTFESAAGPLPYFAMELIRGEPLLRHAEGHALDLRRRLELMVRVCMAVEHAHRKGVVHRDLKPDNVLVDAAGQPKVLDFGVARLSGAEGQLATMHTQAGTLVGTLQYMSPEQVSGDPQLVDARSDVYALGVMLYELLSGRRPYDVVGLSVPDAARAIVDEEPPLLGSLHATLRGDLEVITQRALAKARERRYQDAGALGDDLRRFLADRPIQARQLSALYFVRRFAARNQVLVGSVCLALAALLVGLVVSMTQWRLALEAEERALRQADRERVAAAAAATTAGKPSTTQALLDRVRPKGRSWEWHYLSSDLDRSVYAFDFGDELVSAALAPDGGAVLALLRSGDLVSRPLAGVEPASVLALDATDVRAACFSEDGRRVAAAFGDGWDGLAMWDTQTGRRVAGWKGVGAEPALLQLEGDSLRVAWFPSGTTVSRWDSGSDGVRSFSLAGENLSTGTTLIAMGGERLALIGRQWNVFLLDCAGPGDPEPVVWAQLRETSSMAFSADGRRLAFGSRDKRVRLLDVETGVCSKVLTGHTGPVQMVAFSRNDGALVTIAGDQTLREWDLESQAATVTPIDIDAAGTASMALGRDGDRILTRTHPGLVRVWDGRLREQLSVLRGHTSYVYPVSFSPDGRRVASGSWDGTVRLWDVASGEERWRSTALRLGWELRFSPDGRHVAASSNGPPVLLLDAATGATVMRFDAALGDPICFEWLPDGEHLLVAGGAAAPAEGGLALVFDARDGRLVERQDVHDAAVRTVAISPDGERAAFGGDDGSAIIWDLVRARALHECVGHTKGITALAFSPDGLRLVSASHDGTVRLFDARDGAPLQALVGNGGRVYSAAWSPDGTRVAIGSEDSLVRLFDPRWSEPVLALPGHGDYVYRVTFSPDGALIASSSGDGDVRLWDTRPLRERLALRR